MSNVPNTIALQSIADGALEVAADHRNNYAAIQTAVNALIAALSGGSAGQVLEALTTSTVDWNGGTYQAYVPTWAASGTAVAIGNATAVGRFARLGKMVHAYGQINFGSTSTFGTGSYSFALPVAANAAHVAAGGNIGHAQLNDISAGAGDFAVVEAVSSAAMQIITDATYLGTRSAITNTSPWTWAVSDILSWNILYEAA